MKRILTVDIGNSSIVVGVFVDSDLVLTDRIATLRDYTEKEITKALRNLLERPAYPKVPGIVQGREAAGLFDGSILSSVVPEINEVTLKAMGKLTRSEPLLVNHSFESGIDISRYDKGRIGTDRIVDLAAARYLFPGRPVMVCDLGTCTTITVADDKGMLLGGMIAPGVQMGLDAEAVRTAQLPRLSAGEVNSILGTDTASNMMSGAVAGAGMMISGAAARIASDHSLEDMALIITGGLGRYVVPWIDRDVCYDKDLLLKGLYSIYELNANRLTDGDKYAYREEYTIRSYRRDRGLQVG